MGVGGEGKAPQDFKIWYFPNKFFAKKVVYLVSSGENEILSLLPPLQKYFWPTPGHKRRSRQIFGCAKDFCPKSSKLSRKVLCDFCQQIFPPYFGVTSKNEFMCFSANVGHHFLKSNNVVRHFCPDFQGFCPDFNKSKLFGVSFHPLHPRLLHNCPWKIHFWPLPEKNPSGAHL